MNAYNPRGTIADLIAAQAQNRPQMPAAPRMIATSGKGTDQDFMAVGQSMLRAAADEQARTRQNQAQAGAQAQASGAPPGGAGGWLDQAYDWLTGKAGRSQGFTGEAVSSPGVTMEPLGPLTQDGPATGGGIADAAPPPPPTSALDPTPPPEEDDPSQQDSYGGWFNFAAGGQVPAMRARGAGSRGGRSHFNQPGGGLFRGPVRGNSPGRTDSRQGQVARGSYVMPADVVSGLGQGNTDAGHGVLQNVLAKRGPVAYAQGGQAGGGDPMDVRLSDGEFVFAPEEVAAMGNGDPRAGAAQLDRLVMQVRHGTVEALQRMPPPK